MLFQLIPYLCPYLFLAIGFEGVLYGGIWTFAGAMIAFGLHPVFDYLIKHRAAMDPISNKSKWSIVPQVLLYSYFPFQLIYLLRIMNHVHTQPLTTFEWVGMITTTGIMTGAFGITVAHELIHRRKKWEVGMGVGLLAAVNYTHFRIEHVFGHHHMVATPEDPATAKKGEWLYPFWFRSLFGGYQNAWRLENERLKKQSLISKILRNRMIHYHFLFLVISIAILLFGGIKLYAFWWAQSIVAVLLLETVNYVEHYGLVRKKKENGQYESVKECHSWDSEFTLTNWFLFNLGYHGHHHSQATVPYYGLKPSKGTRKLPFGYSAMILLAFVSPLWTRVMDPLSQQR